MLEADGLQCGCPAPDWHAVYRQMVEQQSLSALSVFACELDPLSKDMWVLSTELQLDSWDPVLIQLQRA